MTLYVHAMDRHRGDRHLPALSGANNLPSPGARGTALVATSFAASGAFGGILAT